jgi:hypothetical protein
MMKSLVVLGGGAIMVAIAVGAVSPASAITNQDNTNLCASPAYQNAPLTSSTAKALAGSAAVWGTKRCMGLRRRTIRWRYPRLAHQRHPRRRICARPLPPSLAERERIPEAD